MNYNKDCVLANLCVGLQKDEIDELLDTFKDKDISLLVEKLNARLNFEEYEKSKSKLKDKERFNIDQYIEKHFLTPNSKYAVYRIIDKKTGFQYIGKANNAYKRWFGHLSSKGSNGQDWHFEMYTRPEDFYFEVVKECATESETYIEEAKLIAKSHYIDNIKLYNSIIPYRIYYSPAIDNRKK